VDKEYKMVQMIHNRMDRVCTQWHQCQSGNQEDMEYKWNHQVRIRLMDMVYK